MNSFRPSPFHELSGILECMGQSDEPMSRKDFAVLMDHWRTTEFIPENAPFWRQVETPEGLAVAMSVYGSDLDPEDIVNSIDQYRVFDVRPKTFQSGIKTEMRKKSNKVRNICAPIGNLAKIQKFLLRFLFDRYDLILSNCCHAYRKERSVVSCMVDHVNGGYMVKMDLSDFFGTIRMGWIRDALVGRLGFSAKAAGFISEICTVQAEDYPEYFGVESRRILPQGAPTSGFLSNLVMISFDQALKSCLKDLDRGIRYSRYSDDIIVTAPKGLGIPPGRIISRISAIARKEGLVVNSSKTRVYFSGGKMRALGLDIVDGEIFPRRDLIIRIRKDIDSLDPSCLENSGSWDDMKLYTKTLGRVGYCYHVNNRLGWILFRELEDRCGAIPSNLVSMYRG